MGHIELASRFRISGTTVLCRPRMGLLLDLTIASLRAILYYEKHVVIDPGDTDLKYMELLSEEEFMESRERFGMSFTAGIGADAIRTLLEQLDLDALSAELRLKNGGKRRKIRQASAKTY